MTTVQVVYSLLGGLGIGVLLGAVWLMFGSGGVADEDRAQPTLQPGGQGAPGSAQEVLTWDLGGQDPASAPVRIRESSSEPEVRYRRAGGSEVD